MDWVEQLTLQIKDMQFVSNVNDSFQVITARGRATFAPNVL